MNSLFEILDLVIVFIQNKQNPTFKDNDFTKDNIKLVVGEETKKNLLEILKGDVEVRVHETFLIHGHQLEVTISELCSVSQNNTKRQTTAPFHVHDFLSNTSTYMHG